MPASHSHPHILVSAPGTELTYRLHVQARSAPRVPTSRLGGQALVPDMLYPLLGAFNPNNARIPTPSGSHTTI